MAKFVGAGRNEMVPGKKSQEECDKYGSGIIT